MGSSTSGQEFLQFHADQGIANIEPCHFFKAHKSPRRLANITSLNDLLARPMKHRIPDPYAQCAELDGWDLYAVNGHYHHAACFDKKSKKSNSAAETCSINQLDRSDPRNDGVISDHLVATSNGVTLKAIEQEL